MDERFYMSNEESGTDGEGCLVKKELPWRSSKVLNFFTELDDFVGGTKSAMAKRQTRQRVLSGVSDRAVPQGPSWAIVAGHS